MRNGQQKRIQVMEGEETSVAEVAAMTSLDG